MWYLTIIFLVIAAICKAVKDTLEFHNKIIEKRGESNAKASSLEIINLD